MGNKKIAEKILEKLATVHSDNGWDYFSRHKVLDSGDKREPREPYLNPSGVGLDDLMVLAKHASNLVDKQLAEYNSDAAKHSAVELAVKTFAQGKYDGKISSVNFYKILNLMNSKTGGKKQMNKVAKFYSARLDKIAGYVRNLVESGQLSPKHGYNLEMALDQVSDHMEGKLAKALQHDSDEKYMANFGEDPATKQQDSDEAYMKDFHNGGQNIMDEALEAGEFDPRKKLHASKVDARKLAEKRNK